MCLYIVYIIIYIYIHYYIHTVHTQTYHNLPAICCTSLVELLQRQVMPPPGLYGYTPPPGLELPRRKVHLPLGVSSWPWGSPNIWMVDMGKSFQWMMLGGSPIYGTPHIMLYHVLSSFFDSVSVMASEAPLHPGARSLWTASLRSQRTSPTTCAPKSVTMAAEPLGRTVGTFRFEFWYELFMSHGCAIDVC